MHDQSHRLNARRGRTLAEVLVGMSILGLLSLIMVLTMTTTRDAGLKSEAHTTSQSACLVALNRLRGELRGAKVSIPSAGQTHTLLRYRRLQLGPDGEVLLTAGGDPIFSGIVTVGLDAQGVLSTTEATPRIMGRLLPGGEVSYTRVSDSVLEVDLKAAQDPNQTESRKHSSRIVARIVLNAD